MGLGWLWLLASILLIMLGVLTAILSLPAIGTSVLLFTVFGGAGILIGYKQKEPRFTLLCGLGIAAWIYAFAWAGMNWVVYHNSALVVDSLKIAVPIVLGTFAAGFLVRAKLVQKERHKTFSVFFKVAFFAVLIVTPFAIGGVLDYNVRADTSPPKVTQLIIVDRWSEYNYEQWTEGWTVNYLKGETLDGSRQFSFVVAESLYNELDIGSVYEIEVHNGALGYEWFDTYP